MNKFTALENIATFLQERTGSVLATWKGKLTAKEQRALFGAFIGKGQIVIDGEQETVQHFVKVCHWNGQDADSTFTARWHMINEEVARLEAWANGTEGT